MSEIAPIAPQPPLSGVRKVDGDKPRHQQKPPARQPNRQDSLPDDDDHQQYPAHIDEVV